MITNLMNVEELTSELGVATSADVVQAVQQNATLYEAYHLRRGNGSTNHWQGYLRGKQWQPREIADLAESHGFTEAMPLAVCIAVCFAESQARDHSYNDNIGGEGQTLSRDCGLMQINIPAANIGTAAEANLYDPDINMAAAIRLWNTRGFQPWAAYNSGVYLHNYYTGRAALGMMNFAVERFNAQGSMLPLPVFTLAQARERIKW